MDCTVLKQIINTVALKLLLYKGTREIIYTCTHINFVTYVHIYMHPCGYYFPGVLFFYFSDILPPFLLMLFYLINLKS